MLSKNEYSIGPIQQLIDLNSGLANFDLEFKIQSTPSTPLKIAVVDQTAVDNNQDIEFKEVPSGNITGNVSQNKNIPQSFFLLLKSDTKCSCTVEINLKEIPGESVPIEQQIPPSYNKPISSSENSSSTTIKNILYFIAVLCIGAIVYYLYQQYYTTNKTETPPPPATAATTLQSVIQKNYAKLTAQNLKPPSSTRPEQPVRKTVSIRPNLSSSSSSSSSSVKSVPKNPQPRPQSRPQTQTQPSTNTLSARLKSLDI